MVTEVIRIDIIESGSRVVKRSLDDIGRAADRATRGLFLLERALYVLGAGGIVTGFAKMLDALTDYENKLRLTTTSVANMEAVQTQLFDVARRSRTAFAAVADIYSRTALSARRLGLSQQDLLDITESLSKAAVVSGANTRESNAALIQLSQGLASNRLNGDELRSILEQLPYVADIIANYLTKIGTFGKVGRGELRELGAEGKLTADLIVAAFQDSKTEIDAAFANTRSTIQGALTNAKTTLLQFIDSMDDTYDITGRVATAINFLADNFENIARSIGFATAALATYYAIFKLNTILVAIQLLNSYYGAIKAGTFAVSGSLQAELARTQALVMNTTAQEAQTASTLRNAQARVANLRASQAQAAQTVLDTQFTVTNGLARNVQTGRFVNATLAATQHNTALNALNITTNSLTAATTRLSAATTAHTVAQRASAAATAQAATVGAAASTMWGRFSLAFPMLAAGLSRVAGLLRGLFVLLAANPFTALAAAIALGASWLYFFGDQVHIATGSIVTFQDVAVGAWQYVMDGLQPLIDLISVGFAAAWSKVSSAFEVVVSGIGTGLAFLGGIVNDTINFIIGAFVGGYLAAVAAWNVLPGAFSDIFAQAANKGIEWIEWMINKMVEGLNAFLSAYNGLIGLAGFEGVEMFQPANLGRANVTGAANAAGAAIGAAFASGFQDYTGNAVNTIMDNATRRAQDRAADNALIAKAQGLNPAGAPDPTITTPGSGGGKGRKGRGGGGADEPNASDYFNNLLKEIEMLKYYGQELRILQEIEKAEKELKRQLTEQERLYVTELVKKLDVAKVENEILSSLRQPQEDMAIRLEAVNNLFRQGAIDIREYRTELARVAQMGVQGGGFMDGVRAGLADVSLQTEDFAKNVKDWVVGSFDAASNAVVEFAKTGQVDIRQFFQDIFANLLKLATDQLFAKLIGGLFGGASGGGGGFFGSLLGFANGGEFMVGGAGGTDSQLVAFKASPDERVSIKTPEQQRAEENAMAGGGGSGNVTVNPVMPVTIINEDSPERTISAMQSAAGTRTIINVIRKNPAAIKKMLS